MKGLRPLRRSARPVSYGVCGPRNVWLLFIDVVGRGRPLKRLVHFYCGLRPARLRLHPHLIDSLHATGHSTRTCIILSRRSGYHRLLPHN